MIFRLAIASTLLMLAPYAPALAAVQCSCPSVKADGEGNSSCSAAESGDRCTVDYNLFLDRETRAAELLRSNGIAAISKPEEFGIELFARIDDRERFPLLATFLSVAAVDQLSNHPGSVSVQDLVELVGQAMDEYGELISAAFSPDALGSGSAEPMLDSDDAVIARGCVELRASGLWIMYKASWSPVAERPRCGGQTLVP